MNRSFLFLCTASALVACSIDVNVDSNHDGSSSDDGGTQEIRAYELHNLVADQGDVADHVDPSLVNPWGLAFGPETYFWVANNGTSTATIYDADGVVRSDLVGGPITLPQPVQPLATPEGDQAEQTGPTGQVYNSVGRFEIAPGMSAEFLFSTTAGTLLGWSSDVDPRIATIVVDNSATGAVYTGLAIAGVDHGALLYAPNFTTGEIDVFDDGFADVDLGDVAFVDRELPEGYAPFGVHAIDGMIYVAYAKRATDGEESTGAGSGFVSQFDLGGNFVARIASNGKLNAPWGIARAPKDFGRYGGALLVGNFGDGRITAYDASSHRALGQLEDAAGKPIAIEGLWALAFGNDRRAGESDDLYFTAGPGEEMHGRFGEIAAVVTDEGSNDL